MKKRKWFSITAKDCNWSYFKGSGKGGQKRNKTENAVRCVHTPSGAVGKAEDTRSKEYNKRLAFERMLNTDHFQSWLKLKIEAGLGNVEIQEGIMTPRKLRKEEV